MLRHTYTALLAATLLTTTLSPARAAGPHAPAGITQQVTRVVTVKLYRNQLHNQEQETTQRSTRADTSHTREAPDVVTRTVFTLDRTKGQQRQASSTRARRGAFRRAKRAKSTRTTRPTGVLPAEATSP